LKVEGCRHLHLVFSVPSPKSCKSVKIVTFVRSVFFSGLLLDLYLATKVQAELNASTPRLTSDFTFLPIVFVAFVTRYQTQDGVPSVNCTC